MLGLLALLALASSAAGCTNNNSWDYLMLVVQWPATECMPQNFGCSDYGQFFTLHGLWPDNFDGSYPCSCTDEPFDPNAISSLLPDMKKFWPSYSSSGSTSFWNHEWTKHGTCATYNSTFITSQKDFFADALSLRSQFGITTALANAGISPSDTRKQKSDDIQYALSKALGAQAAISCDQDGNLETVTVCVSASLKAFSCPKSVTLNSCPTDVVYPSSNQRLGANSTSA